VIPIERSGITVVGGGSLGQVYSGLLALAGAKVALVVTDRTFQRLRRVGRIQVEGALPAHVPVSVAPQPGGSGVVELHPAGSSPDGRFGAIFTTKGQDLAAAARAIEPTRVDWALGLQNGVVKDEILADCFGDGVVLGGVTTLAAERMESGEVFLSSPGTTYVGELDGKPTARVESLIADLNAAGLPAQMTTEIRAVEWSKLFAVGATHATSILDATIGRLGSAAILEEWQANISRDRATLALSREIVAVAIAEGVEIGDCPPSHARTALQGTDEEILDRRLRRTSRFVLPPGRTALHPSMAQDLLANRKIEVEAIYGDLCERAQRTGVSCPWLNYVLAVGRSVNSTALG
jgi:2-dehydropantoate 2-reductase